MNRNYWRYAIFVFCLIGLSISGQWNTTSAQDDATGWTWLYNQATDELVAVYADGHTETYALNTAIEVDNIRTGPIIPLTAAEIAFSPDGRWAAYCLREDPALDNGDDPLRSFTMLVVRDIFAQQTRYAVPDQTAGCRAGQFDEANGLIYFGWYTAEEDGTYPWTLMGIDALYGDFIERLDYNWPAMGTEGGPIDAPRIPTVTQILGDTVIFELQGVADEITQVYEWNLTTDRAQRAGQWQLPGLSYLPATGERVFTNFDPSITLENGEPFNAVLLADGAAARYLYSSLDGRLIDTAFVAGGSALLILEIPAPDPSAEFYYLNVVVLGRDGTHSVVGFLSPQYWIGGTADGYVVFWATYALDEAGYHTIFQLDHVTLNQAADGAWQAEVTPLWSEEVIAPDDYPQNWEAVWVTPMAVMEDLPPFVAPE